MPLPSFTACIFYYFYANGWSLRTRDVLDFLYLTSVLCCPYFLHMTSRTWCFCDESHQDLTETSTLSAFTLKLFMNRSRLKSRPFINACFSFRRFLYADDLFLTTQARPFEAVVKTSQLPYPPWQNTTQTTISTRTLSIPRCLLFISELLDLCLWPGQELH